ncbi:MAG: signal recognition particle receptor subunit alpha, partial [Treponemataceae bacterium]|nr:signal recognition particle receptor subunit alpha [Treponemataceae bacterium]
MAKMTFAEKVRNVFKRRRESDAFFEELADSLIEGDVGARTAFDIAGQLEDGCRRKRLQEEREILLELKEILLGYVKSVSLRPDAAGTNIWMLLGVNGVGKTTSAAKLADFFRKDGVENVLFASADTFRAAAIEQLAAHAERLGVRAVSHQHGSDPAAVIFDAAEA